MNKAANAVVPVLAILVCFSASSQERPAEKAKALLASGSVAKAKEQIYQCADAQNAECQFVLAQWIEKGELFQKDLDTAKKLYELSYQSGYQPAGVEILRLTKIGADHTKASELQEVRQKSEPRGMNSASTRRNDDEVEAGSSLSHDERSWEFNENPKEKPASGSALFEFWLGQPDGDALPRLIRPTCDGPAKSSERKCEGDVVTPAGRLRAAASFKYARLISIDFTSSDPTVCRKLGRAIEAEHGKPHKGAGKVFRALAALSPEIKKSDIPLIFWWGKRNVWTIIMGDQITESDECLSTLDSWN